MLESAGSLRPLRRQAVAGAVAAALACSIAAPAAAATGAGTDWIRIRTDAARRIFTSMPIARRPAAATAPTATLAVRNCDDDGEGSLRATVAVAGEGDTIDFTGLACSTITLTTGAVEIDLDSLVFQGPGRAALTLDGNALDRIFIHPHGGTLSLRGMTVRNGRDRATGFHVAGGGCLASAGYVELVDTTMHNCYAGGEGAYGGALYAYSLTLSNSTLSGNVANGVHEDASTAAFGGAAFVYRVQLVDSTVSGNRAEHHARPGRSSYDIGGAIVAVVGGSVSGSTVDSNLSQGRAGGIAVFNPLDVSNSTISGNTAESDIAGGLFLRWPSTLRLHNSTVTANVSALDGGGVWLNAPGSDFRSSIVSGNSSDIGNRDNRYGSPIAISVDGGNNLIGTTSPMVTLPTDSLADDPRLGPLVYNGGPTRTHALLHDSPAIDAGSNDDDLAFDQRGPAFERVRGSAADIGAFEAEPVVTAAAAPIPAVSSWALATLAILIGALAMLRKPWRSTFP
ncbi:choice-of-anchor Q domain-containing protein [Dokdonella sp.]|uniref:choice-of-anchor Q domain-containing protein n=1 Tax=Dokdonella sp. TaxID=2291710 RepID=UPI00378501E1